MATLKKAAATILLSVCTFVPAIAQNWQVDLEKACRVFSAQSLEMEIEYLFYPSVNATQPAERQTVWLRKMGGNYHLKQYGMEVIRNSRYTAFVNEQAKVAGVGNTEIKPLAATQEEPVADIQEMAKIITEYLSILEIDSMQNKENYTSHYLGISGGTKKYRFDYNSGKFLHSTVYLSTKTGLLEKISCVLRESVEVESGVFQQVRLDMVYRKQETGKKFTEDMFSTDKIVKINSQGEAILAEKYSQYRLLNNIIK